MTGADRVIDLGNSRADAIVDTWGKGLWEGYVSFDILIRGETSLDSARLVDASGTSFPINVEKIRYERLPLPLTLRATTDTSVISQVVLTNVSYEITRVNPVPPQSVSGKFNGATRTAVQVIGGTFPVWP